MAQKSRFLQGTVGPSPSQHRAVQVHVAQLLGGGGGYTADSSSLANLAREMASMKEQQRRYENGLVSRLFAKNDRFTKAGRLGTNSNIGKTHKKRAPFSRRFQEAQDVKLATIAEQQGELIQVRKRSFFSHFYIKMLLLPRQARDKHRES